MAGRKIFAGTRLRRIRNRLKHSQADFAQSLGISPSYLNLIERDQRPLTAQVLLQLHAQHGVNLAELSSDETGPSIEKLKEVVSDPLLIGEIPLLTELTEASHVAPNLVGATIKLYGAYREVLKRLSDLSQEIVTKGSAPFELPFETVRHWLQDSGPVFSSLEALAEDIWFELSPKDDPMAGLKARLRAHSGIDVRIIPSEILGADRARYDRHAQRLLLSERLDAHERLYEVAWLVAALEGRNAIEALAAQAFPHHAENRRLARQALIQILTEATLCPAAKFTAAAQDSKYDIDLLSSRFSVSHLLVMRRLAQLSTQDASEISIGLLGLDKSGAVMEHIGELGFHLPGNGALCGQLPAFDVREDFNLALLRTAENKLIVAISMRQESRIGIIFVPAESVEKTVYNPLIGAQVARPFGSTCRLCNIKSCTLRREPPATRPAALNEFVRGASDFEPM
jgi:XRE family transcriptional regulator, fatty acid utilization regulator